MWIDHEVRLQCHWLHSAFMSVSIICCLFDLSARQLILRRDAARGVKQWPHHLCLYCIFLVGFPEILGGGDNLPYVPLPMSNYGGGRVSLNPPLWISLCIDRVVWLISIFRSLPNALNCGGRDGANVKHLAHKCNTD